uniref:Uncharacterized protein n=1 Tax=viral metagenome TaxID=1070528 RepID=A0A6C0CJK4_9ZZZZ
MKTFHHRGYDILLGETAKENWELFDTSNPDDIWLHLKRFPSGHAFVKVSANIAEKCECCSTSDLEEALTLAAMECKNHTKYRNMQNLKVLYYPVGKLNKGSKVGEIITPRRTKGCELTV